jgi:hypothetical protein
MALQLKKKHYPHVVTEIHVVFLRVENILVFSKGRKTLFLRVQKCLQKSKMDKNKCPILREAKYFLEKG